MNKKSSPPYQTLKMSILNSLHGYNLTHTHTCMRTHKVNLSANYSLHVSHYIFSHILILLSGYKNLSSYMREESKSPFMSNWRNLLTGQVD